MIQCFPLCSKRLRVIWTSWYEPLNLQIAFQWFRAFLPHQRMWCITFCAVNVVPTGKVYQARSHLNFIWKSVFGFLFLILFFKIFEKLSCVCSAAMGDVQRSRQIMAPGSRVGFKGRLRIFLLEAKKLSEKLIGREAIITGRDPAHSFAECIWV